MTHTLQTPDPATRALAWTHGARFLTTASRLDQLPPSELPEIAFVARLTRGSMLEVLRADFVRTARAKGLSERAMVVRHALQAAALPVLSFLGPTTAAVITGSIVIEQIFGIPGIGRYFVQGALNRDYTLVMGVVIFYAVIIIALNLLVDLLYPLFDPRVRHA